MNNKKCRLCLTTTSNINYYSIFAYDNDNIKISLKVITLANINIENSDGLPEEVCESCLEKVNLFLQFKEQCEISDQQLRDELFDKVEFKIQENLFVNKGESLAQATRMEENTFNALTNTVISPQKISTEVNEMTLKILKTNKTLTPRLLKNIQHSKSSAQKKSKTQCSACGKIVSTKFRLQCHMRIHTGEKPYKCDSCGRSFAIAYNLKVHQRTHSGEKPHKCKECGKEFAQSAGLVAHVRLHTGETPYACPMCTRAFRTYSHLHYHKRLHTGEKNYVCNICDTAFITKSDLNQHQKTHSGERSHICNICGIRLVRAYHLSRHMLTHTGEKNFKCDSCHSTYSQKGDLVRHMRKHGIDISKKTTDKLKGELILM